MAILALRQAGFLNTKAQIQLESTDYLSDTGHGFADATVANKIPSTSDSQPRLEFTDMHIVTYNTNLKVPRAQTRNRLDQGYLRPRINLTAFTDGGLQIYKPD